MLAVGDVDEQVERRVLLAEGALEHVVVVRGDDELVREACRAGLEQVREPGQDAVDLRGRAVDVEELVKLLPQLARAALGAHVLSHARQVRLPLDGQSEALDQVVGQFLAGRQVLPAPLPFHVLGTATEVHARAEEEDDLAVAGCIDDVVAVAFELLVHESGGPPGQGLSEPCSDPRSRMSTREGAGAGARRALSLLIGRFGRAEADPAGWGSPSWPWLSCGPGSRRVLALHAPGVQTQDAAIGGVNQQGARGQRPSSTPSTGGRLRPDLGWVRLRPALLAAVLGYPATSRAGQDSCPARLRSHVARLAAAPRKVTRPGLTPSWGVNPGRITS